MRNYFPLYFLFFFVCLFFYLNSFKFWICNEKMIKDFSLFSKIQQLVESNSFFFFKTFQHLCLFLTHYFLFLFMLSIRPFQLESILIELIDFLFFSFSLLIIRTKVKSFSTLLFILFFCFKKFNISSHIFKHINICYFLRRL